ncbi:MAG: class II aldolase/adducin family protein [Desulfobacterales bacterium]|nr:class II aldolase/adducin family protein [Desulfobacterales bacterium]
MTAPFDTCIERFVKNGLAAPKDVLMGVADPKPRWSRGTPDVLLLSPLLNGSSIRSLIKARPSEPYLSIIDYLVQTSQGTIYPRDCETRLFLHDLPVAEATDPAHLAELLKSRKAVILPGGEILAASPDELTKAYVTLSSVCFACFVKFFSDLRTARKTGKIKQTDREMLANVRRLLDPLPAFAGALKKGPFDSEETILAAICEAGRQVVDLRLVDSCFGNISYRSGDQLYISQSGTFLDSLEGGLTRCATDDPAHAPKNASSELPAHLGIIRQTGCRAILHGHPRFSVILSMDCDVRDCPYRGKCHRFCPYERKACGDIPIVSGEVGGGEYGLCHTVPSAICEAPGVIVYGHGVFTCDDTDFNGALAKLIDIERRCCLEYFTFMGMNI